MTEAKRKIVEIIEQVEIDEKLPRGILKEIYEEELRQVHRDVRRNFEAPLRELIIKYFSEGK